MSISVKKFQAYAFAFIIFGFSNLTIVACNNCICYQPPVGSLASGTNNQSVIAVKEMLTSQVNEYITNERPNGAYGFQLFKRQNECFLAFITSNGIMQFASLTGHSKNYSVDVTPYIAGENYPRFLIVGDTVCFLKPKAQTILTATISGAFSLENKKLFSLQLKKEARDFYFMSNPGYANFQLAFPYVLLPYGYTSKPNFIDSTAYICYNLLNNTYKKIIRYPSCYAKCNINGYQSGMIISNGIIYCMFRKHDEIFKYDLKGDLIAARPIVHDCELEEFDESKQQNLAYVRKYQLLGEYNCQILLNDNYLLIIKKLRSERLTDSSVYEAIVFDKNLQQVSEFKINHSIYPFTAFSYMDGFLVFREKLNTALYYEPKNN